MDASAPTAIGREAVETLLTALVAIPSINPALRGDAPAEWFGEAKLAAFVAGWLNAEGIAAELVEVLPGRPNVIARLPGRPGAPRMIWEGHLDTVQVEGMDRPFQARVEGAKLYGRGAVDDKGCLAMFMLALRGLARRGTGCDVTFLAAVDEEVAFRGVLHHIASAPVYDLGVAGEPTGLRVVSACKGVIRFHVDIEGVGAHSSLPEEGVDAIVAAAELVAHLRVHVAQTQRHHALLGGRTLTCTVLMAGEGPNTVPARAQLTFDFRTLPDQTGQEAWQEVADVVARFAEGQAARFVTQPPFIDSVSMEVPGDAAVIAGLGAVLEAAGLPGAPIGVPFGSDASKLTRAGSPTVIFGPGHIKQAHAVDEHVDLDEVARAAELLIALAERA